MTKEFELRVVNKPIYYIELVALLHRLVNDRAYGELQLSKGQNEFLDLLKEFRIKGLELFELYLSNQNIDDIDRLQAYLAGLDKLEFLYRFFGDELTIEELQYIVENPDSIREACSKNKYIASYSIRALEVLFCKTEEFLMQLIDIFRLLDRKAAMQLAKPEVYQEALLKTNAELKAKVPLDVAQGIMGKRFQRVYDFNTYYFAPSYFYMNKPMRTFDKHTQIVVYPIAQREQLNKNALADALKVIGDHTRLEIIQKLSVRPMFGKELAGELGLGTSTVSHHLEQLRSIGLIHEERNKSVKYFSLNINEYNRLCDAMSAFIRN